LETITLDNLEELLSKMSPTADISSAEIIQAVNALAVVDNPDTATTDISIDDTNAIRFNVDLAELSEQILYEILAERLVELKASKPAELMNRATLVVQLTLGRTIENTRLDKLWRVDNSTRQFLISALEQYAELETLEAERVISFYQAKFKSENAGPQYRSRSWTAAFIQFVFETHELLNAQVKTQTKTDSKTESVTQTKTFDDTAFFAHVETDPYVQELAKSLMAELPYNPSRSVRFQRPRHPVYSYPIPLSIPIKLSHGFRSERYWTTVPVEYCFSKGVLQKFRNRIAASELPKEKWAIAYLEFVQDQYANKDGFRDFANKERSVFTDFYELDFEALQYSKRVFDKYKDKETLAIELGGMGS